MNITVKKQYPMLISIMLTFIFLIYLLLFDVSKKAESYVFPNNAILSDNIEVLPLQSGKFLVLSSSENASHISCFDGKNQTIVCSLDLNYKYSSAKVFDNYLYIANCVNNNGDYSTATFKYLISDNSISENNWFCLPIKVENKYSLAAAKNGFIFFINENDRSQIVVMNTSTTEAPTTIEYQNKNFTSLATNFSGTKLYAITADKSFISFDLNNSFSPYSFTIVDDSSCTFLSDDLFISAINKVYSINETGVTNIFLIDNNSTYRSSCLFGNYLLGQISDNLIYCYDIQTKTPTKQITLEGTILALSTSDDLTIAILKNNTEKSIKIITGSDLLDIVTDPDPNENEDPPPDPSYGISSIEYAINLETKTISNVPLSTTIAVFKNNIQNPNNYPMSFVNYLGSSFSSGNLGTGSKVSFDIGLSEPLIFKIIINGDITGEGNKNSRDKDSLYNHLFGKSSLLDEYLAAADLNGDGKVNTIDLLIMDKSFRSS